jgi:sugar/nucleoside kinase (ribokinase family)
MVPTVVIGELNVDLILSGSGELPVFGTEIIVQDFAMTLGSASAICASGLARLGQPVSFAGKVGQDLWGDYCLRVLGEAGIGLDAIVRDARAKTGVTVSITAAHDRALVTYPGAMATFVVDDLPDGLFASPGHLHVSSFYLQSGMRRSWPIVFENARAAGCTISLDPGCDPANAWDADLVALLPLVDVLLPNEVELQGLTGKADPVEAIRQLANGHTLTVAKLGARGAMAIVDDQPLLVAPPPIRPLDTTGAGDSFNAGFLHAWLQGQSVRAALRSGVACGALSTQGLGGVAAQPTSVALAECLAGAW